MDKKLTFKEKIILFLFKYGPMFGTVLTVLLSFIIYSLDITVGGHLYESIWEVADFSLNNNGIHIVSMILIFLFIINILVSLIGVIQTFRKKKGLMILTTSNLLFNLAMLLIRFLIKFTNGVGMFLIIFNLLISVGSMVLVFLYQKRAVELGIEDTSNIKEEKVIELTKTKRNLLAIDLISIFGLLSLFFVPLFTYKEGSKKVTFWLIQGISANSGNIAIQIAFLVVLLTFISVIIYFIHTITFYFNYEKNFVKKSNVLVYSAFAISLVYFLIGYILTLIYSMEEKSASTISIIPFIILTIILFIYSVIKGKYKYIDEEELNNKKSLKFEPLIYLVILSVLAFGLLFVNVIEVHYEYGSFVKNEAFTGLDLLENHAEIGGGYQVLTFVILAVILTSFVLLVLSACSFFSRNKDYYKLTKMSTYLNVLFLFILGISGFYFNIAQKINEENLAALLDGFGLNITIDQVSEIKSQSIFLFAVGLVVLGIAMFRGQFNLKAESEVVNTLPATDLPKEEKDEPIAEEIDKEVEKVEEVKRLEDFDACPVFTELDGKKELFDKLLEKRKQYLFENPTLPELVKFIVDYARECRLHLSYTHEDIATFVAGLGASRLTILQGMSGTGKTSLPKIFSEAILGNCEIVEVESSWRDKNELLGYYNEFSKTYSPKKFTERLYKAKLNPEIVTFIVLDEMNLSRIEYYFSDFLSLMENEEHKREIKLLNVKLQRTENNKKYNYLALEEGHTIKIPTNVWFIGTANRDESTFEISDKVYDRAQTMNFNKRAPKVRSYTKPIPQQYLPYQSFRALLKQAINNGRFEAEDNEVIKEVEKILQPFNISFGNRVLKQIEEFVKIYCACFNDGDEVVDEAVEKILLSKVVAKLEFKNVDNKDKLVKQFNKLNLHLCSEFVSKLNED